MRVRIFAEHDDLTGLGWAVLVLGSIAALATLMLCIRPACHILLWISEHT